MTPSRSAPPGAEEARQGGDVAGSGITAGVAVKPRLSTHGWQDTGDALYVDVGGAQMSLPIGELEWKLRYGNPLAVRFSAASVIDSYEYLIHHCSLKEAARRIMLMRAAYAKALRHRESPTATPSTTTDAQRPQAREAQSPSQSEHVEK